MSSPEPQDGVARDAAASLPARWVAGLVLLFLADAAQLLVLLPARTGELFAWPIRPAINAAILGSAYVAGGYFFVRVATGSPWRLVAAGYPPVMAFVWLAGIATFLHLDRLSGGVLPRAAWVALYVVAPVLVPVTYLIERRRRRAPAGSPRLSEGMRVLLAASGAPVVALGLLAFAWPQPVIDAWPWPLTPLTLRVVASVVALYGAVNLSVAAHGDAEGARIPLESQAIGLAFVLAAMAGAGDAIDWKNAVAPVFAIWIGALLAISVAVRVIVGGRSVP